MPGLPTTCSVLLLGLPSWEPPSGDFGPNSEALLSFPFSFFPHSINKYFCLSNICLVVCKALEIWCKGPWSCGPMQETDHQPAQKRRLNFSC